ncbi:ATP-binding response regulator [Caenispirillum bisanense]|uniref:ATP-binding response regulator n=1 Tax=Caenispirillum bisanense TaxID=414052 RepID=UPI0031E143C6
MQPGDLKDSILEMAPNGIYEIAVDGTILYSNPAHHRLLGYEPGTLVGRSILDLVPEADGERLRADLARLVETQPEPQPYLNSSFTRDGRQIVVEVHWTYKRDRADGRVIGFIAILNDVTTRIEAERLREEARHAAEQAALSRSRFLASASHDLRQPLQALALFVSRLERRDLDPTAREVVGNIRESVATLSSLLNGLLDMSKFDAGMTQVRVTDVPLREVFVQLRRDFGAVAERAGLRLRLRDTDCVVRSDPMLLRRVLGNLVVNAISYTRRGGLVVGARRRGQSVRLEVWDSGIGIPPDQLDLIFQEFYQVGNPARERREGLGLGLAIVDRACRALGHPVEVKSRVGRGSVFAVTVPAALEPAAPAAADLAAAVAAGQPPAPVLGGTVAVVEDDPAVRRALVSLLQDWQCTVIAAANGADLLAALAEARARPDVVIADLRLPGGMDGLAVAAAVSAELGHAVPALVVTGDTDPDRLRATLAAGCMLLHKPIDVGDLHGALTRLLGRTAAG